jgi:hypothetical protein
LPFSIFKLCSELRELVFKNSPVTISFGDVIPHDAIVFGSL